jgi:hypothetical protein
MATIEVYGASDDLIEVEGDIREEFNLAGDEGNLLAFSDGTILRIAYGDQGVWRISTVKQGMAVVDIAQAPEGDEDNYSDRATLTLEDDFHFGWVVHGIAWASS